MKTTNTHTLTKMNLKIQKSANGVVEITERVVELDCVKSLFSIHRQIEWELNIRNSVDVKNTVLGDAIQMHIHDYDKKTDTNTFYLIDVTRV